MKRLLTTILFLTVVTYSFSQQNVKVMTWNIHEYSNYNTPPELDWDNPALKYVITQINPDILVCQEVLREESVNQLLQYVLEYNYLSGSFVQSDYMNSALFYKESIFTFVENKIHPTSAYTRPFNEFVLIHKGTSDTLRIFSLHLKANSFSGNNDENIQKRNNEISALRKRTSQLRTDADFLVLGDLNSLNASEAGIVKLFDQSTAGYVYDPLDAIGQWENNSSFAHTHTMYAQNLTVRFDMILISQAAKDVGGIEYVDGSYKIAGNDGNHFNKAINSGSNSFGKQLADSLISASDHLPVYVTLSFKGTTGVSENNLPAEFQLAQNYPNPFNPATTIAYTIPNVETRHGASQRHVTLKIYDILGQEIVTLVNEYQPPGKYNVKFDVGANRRIALQSGIYFYTLRVSPSASSGHDSSLSKKMIYLK